MTTDTTTPTDRIMIPAWIDGILTPVEKLEAHQRGLKHKAVSVFVLRGDALLIQQRAAGKYHTPVSGRTPAARIPIGTKTRHSARRGGSRMNWASPAST